VNWKDVVGKFHDKFEVKFGIEQMIDDDDMTRFEVLCELKQMLKNAS
jgi:hypothetical protein